MRSPVVTFASGLGILMLENCGPALAEMLALGRMPAAAFGASSSRARTLARC